MKLHFRNFSDVDKHRDASRRRGNAICMKFKGKDCRLVAFSSFFLKRKIAPFATALNVVAFPADPRQTERFICEVLICEVQYIKHQ